MSYRADKQVIDTHTLTDTQTGAMTIPEGQNWPRVKSATTFGDLSDWCIFPDQMVVHLKRIANDIIHIVMI